jgi:hypothetical protein
LFLIATEALAKLIRQPSGVIEATQALTTIIEVFRDTFNTTPIERVASGTGRAAGRALLQCVVVEVEVKTTQDNLVLGVGGGRRDEENSGVKSIEDVE